MKQRVHFKQAGVVLVTLVLVVLATSSFSQALLDMRKSADQPQILNGNPFFIWEDDFSTEEWIDPALSEGYELAGGVVRLKNTYPVWTDPSWTRLLPIDITNTAGSALSNYAVKLTIPYDSDMRPEFEDIRFKHEDLPTTWLDYWVESKDVEHAIVWVNIPVIPMGSSTLFLFYGNPAASDQSDYHSVFSDWQEDWENDEQLSYHHYSEGAWDPDVAYGDQQFLVAWEEGQAPFPPYTYFFKQEIRGSLYKADGELEVFDFEIYNKGGTSYRSEDPSIAYGENNYFVVWEQYSTPSDLSTMDIKGRLVTSSGNTRSVISICSQNSVQADPYVAFDSVNKHYCVVWEDARSSTTNYNIYGRLYDTNGNTVGGEKTITVAANSQSEPQVAFDPINEQYLIVWEEGAHPENGPFDIWVGLFDENLNMIGPGTGSNKAIKIKDGTTSTDHNFPSVAFSPETQKYLVVWNDGDISDNDWWGNIWGSVLDASGAVEKAPFIIRSGNFVRTDIDLYLPTTFMVSYSGGGNIWAKLVSSEGTVFTDEIQLSASTAADADWASIAAGDGRLFSSWEDVRITYQFPWNDNPDSFGNIWQLNIPSGTEIQSSLGTEKKLILTGTVTSKEIAPDDLVSWQEFNVTSTGQISFDIRDRTGTTSLISNAGPGEDLTGIDPIEHTGLRLQGVLTRTTPSNSPTVDIWSITYAGVDDDHPQTTIADVQGDLGDNNWYVSNVKIRLTATDGLYGTGVNHTYYQIGDGPVEEYDDSSGIRLPPDDPNTLYGQWDVTYWSVDKAGNQEPPQGPSSFAIDKAPPHCEIITPSDRDTVRGDFWVEASASDQGSGVAYVLFDTGPPYEDPVLVEDDDPSGSGIYKWLCTRHYERSWRHIIAQVYDHAGHMYEYNVWVYFGNADNGLYTPGYLYLFGNLTLGPIPMLENRDLAITIDTGSLFVRTEDQPESAVSARFTASRLLLSRTFTADDLDVSDGCSVHLDLPMGWYQITVGFYDQYDQLITEEDVISKMLVLLV